MSRNEMNEEEVVVVAVWKQQGKEGKGKESGIENKEYLLPVTIVVLLHL